MLLLAHSMSAISTPWKQVHDTSVRDPHWISLSNLQPMVLTWSPGDSLALISECSARSLDLKPNRSHLEGAVNHSGIYNGVWVGCFRIALAKQLKEGEI